MNAIKVSRRGETTPLRFYGFEGPAYRDGVKCHLKRDELRVGDLIEAYVAERGERELLTVVEVTPAP
jgi:hypothetical protein